MKFIPTLFSTPMVQAILEDRKTQTRRIVKPRSSEDTALLINLYAGCRIAESKEELLSRCPYGKVGSVIWVREEHYRYGKWVRNGLTKNGREKWKFVADKQFIEVRYYDNRPALVEKNAHRSVGWYKRLARFMPKSACRVFLKIEGIRIQQIQEITESDCLAEGVKVGPYPNDLPSLAFAGLWMSIHTAGSWADNPFVYAISFKRIEKPQNFLA